MAEVPPFAGFDEALDLPSFVSALEAAKEAIEGHAVLDDKGIIAQAAQNQVLKKGVDKDTVAQAALKKGVDEETMAQAALSHGRLGSAGTVVPREQQRGSSGAPKDALGSAGTSGTPKDARETPPSEFLLAASVREEPSIEEDGRQSQPAASEMSGSIKKGVRV